MGCVHSKNESHRPVVANVAGTQPESQYPSAPTRYVHPIDAIDRGKVAANIGNDMNARDKGHEKIQSNQVDYPFENRDMSEKRVFTENRDSRYIKSTVLDLPDINLLSRPISKICRLSWYQLAVYHYNTNCYTTVHSDTLAVLESTQLQGSHLTSNGIVVLDAIGIC